MRNSRTISNELPKPEGKGGAAMMVSYKQIKHFSIHATDKDIGGVRDILFDDKDFVIRYVVADTNTWLPLSRKVVISPISITRLDQEEETVDVSMTSDTLKNSPSIDEHKPVSREFEETLFRYFGYGYYWIGPGAWGDFAHPNQLADPELAAMGKEELDNKPENHLRACGEVSGYEVATQEDNVGHISDFVFDIESWQIQMLVVDTNNWLPGGKKLAVLPSDIKSIDWSSHNVSVDLTHEGLMARPEVDLDKLGDAAYIEALIANAKLV